MEQYTTATTTTGEQIVVQTANGQIQQQVNSLNLFHLMQLWGYCAVTALTTPSILRFTDFRFQSVARLPSTGLHLTNVS